MLARAVKPRFCPATINNVDWDGTAGTAWHGHGRHGRHAARQARHGQHATARPTPHGTESDATRHGQAPLVHPGNAKQPHPPGARSGPVLSVRYNRGTSVRQNSRTNPGGLAARHASTDSTETPTSMFDALSERLRKTLGSLTGRGRVSEADVDAAMREVRLALLEADVNFKVVRDFVARVRERAVGADILESLTAGQQVVTIVNEELTALLSAGDRTFHLQGNPAVVMLVGLQGSGKTTSAAKLARTSSSWAAGRCSWRPTRTGRPRRTSWRPSGQGARRARPPRSGRNVRSQRSPRAASTRPAGPPATWSSSTRPAG